MKNFLTSLFFLTVVISDPFKGLKYDKINVYEVEKEYEEDCIHIHEVEVYNPSEEDIISKDKEEEMRRGLIEIFRF